MNTQSIALAFRLELDFHALNNEGAGGTNVMEPRRIALGNQEYDGISGEMVRRHILENFVRVCQARSISLHKCCKGLVPSRGLEYAVSLIQTKGWQTTKGKNLVPGIAPEHYPEATHTMLSECAVCDVGGYLFPLGEQTQNLAGALKRDSAFEVGWLISEHPALTDYTQHAAYDPDPGKHNLFVQNIRSGVYGGVMRIDMGRIGHNDWAWLAQETDNRHLADEERKKRATALLDAIEQYLLSPSGAKQTGWLPHAGGVCEGIVVVSEDGPAPFISPLHLSTPGDNPTVGPNTDYREAIQRLAGKRLGEGKQPVITTFTFDDMAELAEAMQKVRECLDRQATT